MKAQGTMTRLEYERRSEAQRYSPKTYEERLALFELLEANVRKEVWILPSLYTKSSHKRRVLLRSVDILIEAPRPFRNSTVRSRDSSLLGDPVNGIIVCSIKYTGPSGRPIYQKNINGNFIRPIEEH